MVVILRKDVCVCASNYRELMRQATGGKIILSDSKAKECPEITNDGPLRLPSPKYRGPD